MAIDDRGFIKYEGQKPQPVAGKKVGGCICPSGACVVLQDSASDNQARPCDNSPTQEDLLCDGCRKLKGKSHCHPCSVKKE